MKNQDNVTCGVTPENITSLKENEVFVFGSNLGGYHGGGAAAFAMRRFGAVWGQGVGLQGQSYAIPTMQGGVETIKPYVDDFIEFVKTHPDKHFYVTKIGCGIAGFTTDEIAPLFKEALHLQNVSLPEEFIEYNVPAKADVISWEAEDFRKEYNRLIKNPSMYYEVKILRAREFRNTVELVNQGYYLNATGEKVPLTYDGAGQAVFYSSEIINDPANRETYENMTVDVVDDDCLAVAMEMIADGYNPAVLNIASRRNPGGGVTTGAGAQEETLFRRTDLFRSLYQFAPYAAQYGIKMAKEQYPLDRNFGGVYTPKALIFRSSEKEGYALMDTPVMTSFISVAGMNRPDLTADNRIADHHIEPIKNKIRTILRIGVTHHHDSLVLGALGCGAFRNPPRHVAQLFREVLEEDEFKGAFKKIVFAILDDHNAHKEHNPEGNFKPFEEVFKDFGKKADAIEMPQDMVKFLERSMNWILPGCQLFYRDTDADIDVEKAYPIGAIIRAGFFIDVTVKAQRPVTKLRYIIASAHCAKLYEAMDDEDMKRWRLCTLHFNSYFKVMDVYEKDGVTQVFLLHVPYKAVPFFRAEHSMNFIQGASQINLVEVARKSLDTKLRMDVFADTTEPDLLERMQQPVGLDSQGNPVSIDFMMAPPHIEALSNAVRQLGEDMDNINYPEGYMQ